MLDIKEHFLKAYGKTLHSFIKVRRLEVEEGGVRQSVKVHISCVVIKALMGFCREALILLKSDSSFCCVQGDTSGDYRKILLELCGGE